MLLDKIKPMSTHRAFDQIQSLRQQRHANRRQRRGHSRQRNAQGHHLPCLGVRRLQLEALLLVARRRGEADNVISAGGTDGAAAEATK